MRNEPLSIPLLSSCFIHIAVILLASLIIHHSKLLRQEFLPISLVDVPPKAKEIPIRKEEIKPEIKKPPPPPPKVEKVKETKREIVQPERPASPLPPPVKEEPEPKAGPSPSPRFETGGSEAGAGSLFSKGDIGVVPGPGSSGGGGGTAVSGLGRGSNAPGLPTQSVILKTNREAKPIQSARATYPPLALRMGIEGDVTLRIEVDPEGKVTKAEIIKSGGSGFDEEALKGVKQSRFEPAQKDGQNVAAEFTYVYRFRLAR